MKVIWVVIHAYLRFMGIIWMMHMKPINNNYKVLWVYNGVFQYIPEMYDRPKRLCQWWMRQHKTDSQYAVGKFLLLSMMENFTS
jgi:hypothetical protein